MAQSRCPLAKLKYLAFGRARKRLQRTEICDFTARTSRTQALERAATAVAVGNERRAWRNTCSRDTRDKFHTTTEGKDLSRLRRDFTLLALRGSSRNVKLNAQEIRRVTRAFLDSDANLASENYKCPHTGMLQYY